MRTLIAALAVAAGAAMADPVARSSSGDWVRFTQAECPAVIADKIPPELRERFRKAYPHVGGQEYVACWVQVGQVRALVYEDGDQGVVPEIDVHEEPGA